MELREKEQSEYDFVRNQIILLTVLQKKVGTSTKGRQLTNLKTLVRRRTLLH